MTSLICNVLKDLWVYLPRLFQACLQQRRPCGNAEQHCRLGPRRSGDDVDDEERIASIDHFLELGVHACVAELFGTELE